MIRFMPEVILNPEAGKLFVQACGYIGVGALIFAFLAAIAERDVFGGVGWRVFGGIAAVCGALALAAKLLVG